MILLSRAGVTLTGQANESWLPALIESAGKQGDAAPQALRLVETVVEIPVAFPLPSDSGRWWLTFKTWESWRSEPFAGQIEEDSEVASRRQLQKPQDRHNRYSFSPVRADAID